MEQLWRLERGATVCPDGAVRFTVWAPRVRQVAVQLLSPVSRTVRMEEQVDGLYTVTIPGIPPATQYVYLLDEERNRPDPVSRFQPAAVHGPSAVVDPAAFLWTDQEWKGLPLTELILYELHSGTFTCAGTFTSIISYLQYLKHDVGITAVELMPVAEFPGARNWGSAVNFDGKESHEVR